MALSIGEPATQITLRTFHSAGESSKLITGVPRLDEIVKASEKPISPAMFCILHNGYIKQQAENICKRIIRRSLLYYVQKIQVSPSNYTISYTLKNITDNVVLLSEILSRLTHYLNNLLKREKNVKITSTNTIITIQFTEETKLIDTFLSLPHLTNAHIQSFWDSLSHRIATETWVHGIEGVKNAWVHPHQVSIARWNDQQQSVETQFRWKIETQGSNFAEILILPFIDYEYTTTNVIHQMLEEFDIEATRMWINDHIEQTLSENGASVLLRHMDLLSRVMTHKGKITEMTRKGIDTLDNNPLRTAVFEAAMDQFKTSAIFNKKDPLLGITECVVMSNTSQSGTGMTKCVSKKSKTKLSIDHAICAPNTLLKRVNNEKDYIGNKKKSTSSSLLLTFIATTSKAPSIIVKEEELIATMEDTNDYRNPNSPSAYATMEDVPDYTITPLSPTIDEYDPEAMLSTKNESSDSVFVPRPLPEYLKVRSSVCGTCKLNEFF